jgi:F-type H+-transporting ATPase subunit b
MELLLPKLGLFFWNLVSFVVVFLLLRKFAWKTILNALREREQGIADSLASAEKVKSEMALLKNENEQLMAKAMEERAQLMKDARETRDRIVNEAKELAKTEANKIIQDAHASIHQQKMAAITDLKNQVGNLVVEVSEKILRRELVNKSEQESYISKLTEDVKFN